MVTVTAERVAAVLAERDAIQANLASGTLAGLWETYLVYSAVVDRVAALDPTVIAIAKELAATSAQVALAWLLAHYDKTLLIPGTSSPVHLTENNAAGSIRLSPESIAAIDLLAVTAR